MAIGNSVRIGLASLLAWAACGLGAPAGEDALPAETQVAPEVVVTATRTAKDPHDTPGAVQIVTTEDLRERQMARTVPEALKASTGVMVQKTAHGHGSPYIRGFTSFRNLFLIDGIRLNNAVFRPGPNQYWNTVDPLGLERLEIVSGPGSVLYGSDAVGGTVNAITRSPTGYGEGVKPGGRLFYRGSTAEASNQGRAEVQITVDERFGALLGASLKDFGDLNPGEYDGRLPRTGYDEWDGDLKLEFFATPEHKFTFALQNVDQDDVWRTHKTVKGANWHGTDHGDERQRVLDQDRHLGYLRYEGEKLGRFVDAVRVTLSLQEQEEIRRRIKNDGRRDEQGFDVDTFGAQLQLESPSPIGRWTYGGEFYRDHVDSFKRGWNADGSFRGESIQGPVADDSTYDLVGLFVQDDISLGERVNLILGGRYNYVEADVNEAEDPVTGNAVRYEQDWDSVIGSARILWHVDAEKHWNLWAGVSQAFRAPNLSDLSRLDSARSNEFETGSTNLEPEEYVSYEFGLKTRYDHVTATASYFYNDIDGMILRTPTGRTNADGEVIVTKTNAGDGYVHGVELGARWRFHPQLTLFGSGTLLYGEVENFPDATTRKAEEPLSRLMPPTAQLGLRWDHPTRHLWVEGLCDMADDADHLNTRDKADTNRIPPGGTPGYAVFTIRGGWQVHERVTFTAALENLFDEDYRIHGSGLNEPGRNLVVGLDVTF